MANIFKKIKAISEVKETTPKAKASKDALPMGLKPVLKASSGDIVTASDFEDPFGDNSIDDLEIPALEIENDEISDSKTEEENPQSSEPNAKPKSEPEPTSEPEAALESKPSVSSPDAQTAEDIEDSPSVDLPNFLSPMESITHDEVGEIIEKPLNLRPIDDPLPPTPKTEASIHSKTKVETIIKSIDTVNTNTQNDLNISEVSQAPHKNETFPSFITGESTPTLNMPAFVAPKWPYWALALMAFFWVIGSAAATYGYFELGLNALTANPIHALGFVGFILIPACLLLLTIVLLRRLNNLSIESQKLAFLNHNLLTPSDYAAQTSKQLSNEIRQQMDHIEQRADQAFDRLKTVQSAFSEQIESVSNILANSVTQQSELDTQLHNSKTAWAGTMRQTQQTISDLSGTLDNVLTSFQTRIQTTHETITQLGATLKHQSETSFESLNPILKQTEQLEVTLSSQAETVGRLRDDVGIGLEAIDDLLTSHAQKLTDLRTQQDDLKAGTEALNTTWADSESLMQDRVFNQFSQIDALNERTDELIQKMSHVTETIKNAADNSAKLPLRGTFKEEQLSLLPGLGDTKNMLPSLLSEYDDDDPLTLSYEDINPADLHPAPLQTTRQVEPDIPQSLSSDQVFGSNNHNSKPTWLKRFGRRSTDPIAPANINPTIERSEPAPPPPQPTQFGQVHMSLRDRLIDEQLSPDALIDTGCIRRAAQLRHEEGPFAMSQYIATHLGAAAQHLKALLPDNPALRTQVHDIAASFPIREKLDMRDEDALIFILSSDSGREYLLCDAALNG